MSKDRDIVTDHAVVRYLENVYGVDIRALKARIETTTKGARNASASSLVRDGVRYCINSEGRVTTVFGVNAGQSNRARRWKRRRK